MMIVMGTAFADERPVRKPSVDAPRQVIGFDLSGTAAQSGLALHSDDDDINDTVSEEDDLFSIKFKMATTKSTAISPRSALHQQLLLPTVALSNRAPSFSADSSSAIKLPHQLSCLKPASCKASAGKQPTNEAAKRRTIKIGNQSPQPSEATTIHTCSGRSEGLSTEKSWDAKDLLLEVSKVSMLVKQAVTEIECPRGLGPLDERKRDSADMNRKQANMHIPDKSKKSSLFILGATSPIAESTNQYFHDRGAHLHKSPGLDMGFLSSCHLCRRSLGQGHDVFMYSGDKAFCSMECRYQQIVMDKRKERCAPLIIRAGALPAYRSHMANNASNAVNKLQRGAMPPATSRAISINPPNFINPATAA